MTTDGTEPLTDDTPLVIEWETTFTETSRAAFTMRDLKARLGPAYADVHPVDLLGDIDGSIDSFLDALEPRESNESADAREVTRISRASDVDPVRPGDGGPSANVEAAAAHYERCGDVVLDRGWHHAEGILDLVAVHGATLAVVEVRPWPGRVPEFSEAVPTRAKAARLRRLASRWMAEHGKVFDDVRLDVAVVNGPATVIVYTRVAPSDTPAGK